MPETRVAYDALAEAIDGVWKATDEDSGDDTTSGVMTEFLVIATRREYDDDGHLVAATAILPSGGHLPHHIMLGLVEHARIVLRQEATD